MASWFENASHSRMREEDQQDKMVRQDLINVVFFWSLYSTFLLFATLDVQKLCVCIVCSCSPILVMSHSIAQTGSLSGSSVCHSMAESSVR